MEASSSSSSSSSSIHQQRKRARPADDDENEHVDSFVVPSVTGTTSGEETSLDLLRKLDAKVDKMTAAIMENTATMKSFIGLFKTPTMRAAGRASELGAVRLVRNQVGESRSSSSAAAASRPAKKTRTSATNDDGHEGNDGHEGDDGNEDYGKGKDKGKDKDADRS
jgi:hypothetical protein